TACLESLKPLAHNPRQDNIVEAQKDTGEWIISTTEYQEWLHNNRSHVLWLLGKAGSGKSTLLLKLLKKTLGEHNLPNLGAMIGEMQGIPHSTRIGDFQETTTAETAANTRKIIV